MGAALCCCPATDDFEEFGFPTNSIYAHCICLRFFFHHLFTGYGARLEGRPTSPNQGATSFTSTAAVGMSDTYEADQRYSRLQRDGLVSRKSMSHFQDESQSLRRSVSNSGMESSSFGKKRNELDSEDGSGLSHSELEKILATKFTYGLSYLQPSSDDEDVCPTCLDEYTPENPKITTRCSHHFHLGCIYEWLERSENCPVCGKEMEFCESP